MNTLNKNIIRALYEATSKPTFPASIKKFGESFIEELEDTDFKNSKDVEYFMDSIIEFAEDHITDIADKVYANYVFYSVDDSDYDREYGYGKSVSIDFEPESAKVNKKVITDTAKEIVDDISAWLKDKNYNIDESLIKKFDDNKDLILKKFTEYFVEYFEKDYIDTYLDGFDSNDDRIAYQK